MHIEGGDAKEALAILAEALKDMDPEIRLQFAAVLGELGENAAGALPALNAALKDEDLQVRRTAALSITQIDPKQIAGAVKVLAEGLTDDAPEVREHLATVLGNLRAEALEAAAPLAKLMKDEVESVRLASAVALLQIQGAKAEGAAEIVNQLLTTGDPTTRANHVWNLIAVGEAALPTLPGLTKLLKDEDVPLRRAAAFAVGQLQGLEKSKEALGVLLEVFDDPDADTRASVISWMENFKPPVPTELIGALMKAAKNKEEDVSVRRMAAYVVCRLQGLEKSKDALAVLIEGFRHPDPTTRADFISMMAHFAPPVPEELIEALKKAAKDEDEVVKVTAESVLSELTKQPSKEPTKE